jgi:YcxB-like protein
MRITYRLTFDDYYDAAQARNAKDRYIRGGLVLAIAVLLFGAWMRTRNTRAGHIDLVLALLVLVSLPLAGWLSKLSFKKAYRRGATNGANEKFTLEISEEGIQSADSTNREKWLDFSKYSESDNAFIIYRADSIHVILPKRAFDVNDVGNFRQLIKAKLARF